MRTRPWCWRKSAWRRTPFERSWRPPPSTSWKRRTSPRLFWKPCCYPVLLLSFVFLTLLLPLPGLVEEYEGGGVGAQGGGLSEHTHTHTPTVTAAWSVLQRGAAPPHSRQTGGLKTHSPPEVAGSTVTPHSQVTQKAPTSPQVPFIAARPSPPDQTRQDPRENA